MELRGSLYSGRMQPQTRARCEQERVGSNVGQHRLLLAANLGLLDADGVA